MCFDTPNIQPAAAKLAAPTSDAASREGELERLMRRRQNGVAADILTSPLGIPNGTSAAQSMGITQ